LGQCTVVWGAANKVKPNAPFVVIRMGTVTRPKQPIAQFVNGNYVACYPTETTVQVDLFTQGKLQGNHYVNTAVSDLLRFVNYLDSPATVDWCERNDISIQLLSGVQDLSEIVNDTAWSYRAMCEFRVNFTEWVAEYEAVLGNEDIKVDENGNITQDGAVVFDDTQGNPIDIVHTTDDPTQYEQTPSGGGTHELADARTGYFTEVETPKYKE
jgi:hypothetical protein